MHRPDSVSNTDRYGVELILKDLNFSFGKMISKYVLPKIPIYKQPFHTLNFSNVCFSIYSYLQNTLQN